MFARLFDHNHADRTVPAMFGIYFLWSAGWLYAANQQDDAGVFFGWLWPFVFGAAGVLALGYALWPWNRVLFASSAGVMVSCCVSRAVGLLEAIYTGNSSIGDSRLWFGIGTWVAFGYGLSLIWIVFLRPLNRRWG